MLLNFLLLTLFNIKYDDGVLLVNKLKLCKTKFLDALVVDLG